MPLSSYQNRLLAGLPHDELAAIEPLLEPINLPKALKLALPEEAIEHVYFLEEGLGSIVSVSPEGQKVEAGMFGYEGFAPTPPAVVSSISFH